MKNYTGEPRKDRTMSEPLRWHCADCGHNEIAQSEYQHGDTEPCIYCENGTARVMTLREAAACEQAHALEDNTNGSEGRK